MQKVCVFCGKKPVEKSKEHVLPQWLIEMTGDSKRILKLPLIYSKAKKAEVEMSFDSFHFPACSHCNSLFSQLEGSAKRVVESMLQRRPLTAAGINVLLEWLDKVRIGLWLGFLYLEENPFDIAPTFHISGRLSLKDRMVAIYHTEDHRPGLQFLGVNLPAFHHGPCCFTLVVHNFYLFNVSDDFLFSRRLGLPYPADAVLVESGLMGCNMVSGRERAMLPLLGTPLREGGVEIYQPIVKGQLQTEIRHLYDTDYVRRLIPDSDTGVGKPMIAADGVLVEYPSVPSSAWIPSGSSSRTELEWACGKQTLEIQCAILERRRFSDKRVKRLFRQCINFNRRYLATWYQRV